EENNEMEMLSNSESFDDGDGEDDDGDDDGDDGDDDGDDDDGDDCLISESIELSCNSSFQNSTRDVDEDEACTSWADICSFFSHSQCKEHKERRSSRYREASLLKKRRADRSSLELSIIGASTANSAIESRSAEVNSDAFFAFNPTSNVSAAFEWCCKKCAEKGGEVRYETQFLLCARLHALYHMFMVHNNERERLLAKAEKCKIEQEIGVLLEFRIRTEKDIEGAKCFADEIDALSISDYRLISAVLRSAHRDVDVDSNIYLRVCFCYEAFADYTQLHAHLTNEHGFVFRKCFVCVWSDKRPSEIVLRLMAVYHLRNAHHKHVRAMCIASNEKWFLEKKLEVKLRFTPPTQNEISTILRTSGTEIAKRLQVTDERILTAIRNSTVGVIKSDDLSIVCFCYRMFKQYFSYEMHLRNVHFIAVPRRKDVRMMQIYDLKSSRGSHMTVDATSGVRQSKTTAIKSRSSKHLNCSSFVEDDTHGDTSLYTEQKSRALIACNYRELLGGGFCVGSSKLQGKRMHRRSERFFWKCGLCSAGDKILSNDDCILYSEVGAILSLWAHLQKQHSKCDRLADSLWCIIAAENNFPATPPCLEMIEEKPLSYERSFGSIACFKCDHFPIFYISDEFSLIVHLVQVHMTDVDNEILDFLDERKDVQNSFPYLSTTNDDYFTARLASIFLHCRKCGFKCICVEKLIDHAMWHYHNPYFEADEALLTHIDNSIVNHFTVEEPILEYTIMKSYKAKQPPRRRQACVTRICRQCFSLMDYQSEMRILE
uniref:C2H2-type domain-containing protein n=1 Tax=Parascaris univalens TaxID=6257 RepID=A0A915B8M9_PARUN